MQKDYCDFFEKPYNIDGFNPDLYEMAIPNIDSKEPYSKQLQELFKVCFSHHVEPNVYLNKDSATKLKFRSKKDNDVFFEDDNLSAYFLEKYYKPPQLYEGRIDQNTKKSLESITENHIQELQKIDHIRSFNDFQKDVTRQAFDDYKNAGVGGLGTNRCRFLIGEIGEGKTALLTKLYRNILIYPELFEHKSEDTTIRLVPIYYEIDFKFKEEPRPLEEYFFKELYIELYDTIEKLSKKGFIKKPIDLEEYNYEEKTSLSSEHSTIKLLISFTEYLAANNIKLLIIIDNIDSFHYYFARYAFFEKGLESLNKSINSLEEMMQKFMPSSKNISKLENAGLSIIFSMRNYVYDFIKTRNPLFNKTDRDENTIYTILPIGNKEIILSRARLFRDALTTVSSKINLAEWHQTLYFEKIDNMISEANNEYFTKITNLSHHGNRSLVDFITDSLSIDIRDKILGERLLLNPKSIVLDLYILNNHRKYTQEKEFFPNLFLNDCLVYHPPHAPDEAHQPHKHTYFLKYFILKYIIKKKGVTFNKVLRTFSKYYDNHLVRHVVGSLCTANEFQCAEIPLAKTLGEVKKSKIMPTKRGISLLERGTINNYPNIEFCFSFHYLKHVLDDKWLSFPIEFIDKLYNPEINYGIAYQTTDRYEKESIKMIKTNSSRIYHFLFLLENSLEFEIHQNNQLGTFLTEEQLIPDFYNIAQNIIDHTHLLLNDFNSNVNFNSKNDYNNAKKLDYKSFFDCYRTNGAPNVEEI